MPKSRAFLQTIHHPRNHFRQMLDSPQDMLAFFLYPASILSFSFLALILPAVRGCNFLTEQNTNWGRKMCSLEKIGGQRRRASGSHDGVIILITAAAPRRWGRHKTRR